MVYYQMRILPNIFNWETAMLHTHITYVIVVLQCKPSLLTLPMGKNLSSVEVQNYGMALLRKLGTAPHSTFSKSITKHISLKMIPLMKVTFYFTELFWRILNFFFDMIFSCLFVIRLFFYHSYCLAKTYRYFFSLKNCFHMIVWKVTIFLLFLENL